MATAETGPISSLLAIRKVVLPNPGLRLFRDQIKADAKYIFGFSGTHTVEVPASLDSQLRPDYEAEFEDVGKLEADVFSLHSLRVVLFARRARASQEVNELLASAHARLSSKVFYTGRNRRTLTGRKEPIAIPNDLGDKLKDRQRAEGYPNGILPVTASRVLNVSQIGSSEQIYDLKIDDDTPYARVLQGQHVEIEMAASRIQAAKGLARDERFDSTVDPLGLRLMRMPGGRNRETERFDEAINLHNAVDFTLDHYEWRLRLAEPD